MFRPFLANDVTVSSLSNPTCLLQAFQKLYPKPKTIPELKSALQQIWDDLPQTTINKAVNDFRKRLNKCVSAGGGHFEHMM